MKGKEALQLLSMRWHLWNTRRLLLKEYAGMSTRYRDPVAPCHFDANAARSSFQECGYTILPNLVPAKFVAALNSSLEDVLCGIYSRGIAPDKIIPRSAAFVGQKREDFRWPESKKTVQVVNIWKASREFEALVLSRSIGKIVCDLGRMGVGS